MRRFNTLSVIKLLTLPNSSPAAIRDRKIPLFRLGFAIFIERAERNAGAVKMGKPKSAIGSGATEEEPSSDQPSGIYLAAEG